MNKMLEGIQAVIFDMDGTLIDSMWLWEAIDIEYLNRFNIETPQDIHKAIEGMSFSETAIYFKERFQLPSSVEDIKDDWNAMAADYYKNRVPLKNGAIEFLNFLNMKKLPLGIGTSNSRELVNIVLDEKNIRLYFKSIRTSCEVDRGKPFPDIFLKVAEDLGVEPNACLVFEDVPNGVKAALAAGMKVCGVYDEFSHNYQAELKSLTNYYIMDFSEIVME